MLPNSNLHSDEATTTLEEDVALLFQQNFGLEQSPGASLVLLSPPSIVSHTYGGTHTHTYTHIALHITFTDCASVCKICCSTSNPPSLFLDNQLNYVAALVDNCSQDETEGRGDYGSASVRVYQLNAVDIILMKICGMGA